MALRKITEADLAGKGVVGMEDVPGLPAEEMQYKVEELVRRVVIPVINENIDNTATKEELNQAVFDAGAGDMSTVVYDTDKDGVVDMARNGVFGYIHSKVGTAHSLTGSGETFRFTATADWVENDTITVNDTAAEIYNYNGERVEGEKLFAAGAVICGTMVKTEGETAVYKVYPFRTGAAAKGCDGNTVTPVDDVTVWQQCAGLETAMTMEAILADRATIAKLLGDFNAMNYLIRSMGLQRSVLADTGAVEILDRLAYQSVSCQSDETMPYGTVTHLENKYNYHTNLAFRTLDSEIGSKYAAYFGPGWVQWEFGGEVGEKWIYKVQFVNTTKQGGVMCRGVTKDGEIVNLFSEYNTASSVLAQYITVPNDKKYVAFRVISDRNAYLTQCKFWGR